MVKLLVAAGMQTRCERQAGPHADDLCGRRLPGRSAAGQQAEYDRAVESLMGKTPASAAPGSK